MRAVVDKPNVSIRADTAGCLRRGAGRVMRSATGELLISFISLASFLLVASLFISHRLVRFLRDLLYRHLFLHDRHHRLRIEALVALVQPRLELSRW